PANPTTMAVELFAAAAVRRCGLPMRCVVQPLPSAEVAIEPSDEGATNVLLKKTMARSPAGAAAPRQVVASPDVNTRPSPTATKRCRAYATPSRPTEVSTE